MSSVRLTCLHEAARTFSSRSDRKTQVKRLDFRIDLRFEVDRIDTSMAASCKYYKEKLQGWFENLSRLEFSIGSITQSTSCKQGLDRDLEMSRHIFFTCLLPGDNWLRFCRFRNLFTAWVACVPIGSLAWFQVWRHDELLGRGPGRETDIRGTHRETGTNHTRRRALYENG